MPLSEIIKFNVPIDKIQSYQHFFNKCVERVSGSLYHRKIKKQAQHFIYKYPIIDKRGLIMQM